MMWSRKGSVAGDENNMAQSHIEDHADAFDLNYISNPIAARVLKGLYIDDPVDYVRANTDGLSLWFHQQFNKDVYQLLPVRDHVRMLNVGSLWGFEEKRIQRRFHEMELTMYGVDISWTGVYTAVRNRPVANYALAQAERLPFSDNSFDIVLSREVVEHVLDPSRMMSEICRVLAPGGTAVITTPNATSIAFDHVLKRVYKAVGFSRHTSGEKDEHLRLGQLGNLFEGAGLSVKRRILDGAFYFLSFCVRNRQLRTVLTVSMPFFASIARLPGLDRILCDQVKYLLAAKKKECEGPPVEGPELPVDWQCVRCRARLDRGHRCAQCGQAFFDEALGAPNFISSRPSAREALTEADRVTGPTVERPKQRFRTSLVYLYYAALFFTIEIAVGFTVLAVARAFVRLLRDVLSRF